MIFAKAIEHVGTVTELKRVAAAYVIDYRNLNDDEVKAAMIKTAPQYYFEGNVKKALDECLSSFNRDHRTITSLFLGKVLLQKDDFMSSKRETEDEVVAWEQSIVDRSNEDLFKRDGAKTRNLELFKFVLETAWSNNDQISPDENHLIEKLRCRLKVTEREYRIVEAKLGKFPKPENQLHTRGEIDEVRRVLQTKGLLFAIRDGKGTDFDVIPEEIGATLRSVLELEIRSHGCRELVKHRFVRSKPYLIETLQKCGIEVEGVLTVEQLQEMVVEQVKPSVLIGGLSPKDGLPMDALAKWCSELGLNISGAKAERISRIITFYDNLLEKDDQLEDEREIWYQHFAAFASRQIEFLRSQQLIEKDIEIERKFEEATNYLFETKFQHKPLNQIGTNHADGALSYRDSLLLWDNKSKEQAVNLKDHIRQFDGYVKGSDKSVACFLVIGPDFTPESGALAMQYQVENGTTMTLITAEELKGLAEQWSNRAKDNTEGPFPLGYLAQPGRFNRSLVAAI